MVNSILCEMVKLVYFLKTWYFLSLEKKPRLGEGTAKTYEIHKVRTCEIWLKFWDLFGSKQDCYRRELHSLRQDVICYPIKNCFSVNKGTCYLYSICISCFFSLVSFKRDIGNITQPTGKHSHIFANFCQNGDQLRETDRRNSNWQLIDGYYDSWISTRHLGTPGAYSHIFRYHTALWVHSQTLGNVCFNFPSVCENSVFSTHRNMRGSQSCFSLALVLCSYWYLCEEFTSKSRLRPEIVSSFILSTFNLFCHKKVIRL